MWKKLESIDGFFSYSNYLVWKCLVECQNLNDIKGNWFEIGVWKGRSAAAFMELRNKGEKIVLVDFLIDHIGVLNALKSGGFDVENVESVAKKSAEFGRFEKSELEGTVRWFHVDGDHSAQCTYNDIGIADRFISGDGVIILDDFFNPRYVSVAWAIFDYMRTHPHSLRMVLAGDNKAYLCRPARMAMYRNFILQQLPAFLSKNNCRLALHQSYSMADCDTLGLDTSFKEGRTFLGFDTDLEMRTYDTITTRELSKRE
jgi:hypothetical protein